MCSWPFGGESPLQLCPKNLIQYSPDSSPATAVAFTSGISTTICHLTLEATLFSQKILGPSETPSLSESQSLGSLFKTLVS